MVLTKYNRTAAGRVYPPVAILPLASIMLVFFIIATTLQLAMGQGDHRRRPSELDEDDATFAKVRVNITHTLNFTFGDIRRFSHYNQVRKNTVLDGLNISAPVAEDVKNPLFLQPEETERIAATSDAAAAGITPPTNSSTKAEPDDLLTWFTSLSLVGMYFTYYYTYLLHI